MSLQNKHHQPSEWSRRFSGRSYEEEYPPLGAITSLGRKMRIETSTPSSENYFDHEDGTKKLDFSEDSPYFEPFTPFDICFSRKNYFNVEGTGHSSVLRPGMVVLKRYINVRDQIQIVKTCQELGKGPGGFYQPGYKSGAKLRLQMMCLGLNWDPETREYEELRSFDGCEPPAIPGKFLRLVQRAIQDAHALIEKDLIANNVEEILPAMSPDICIVSFYNTRGRLGLHQDRDETNYSFQKGLPVISFSVGDSAEFLYSDERDSENAEKIVLESGDVLIFGSESRLVFHCVSRIIPNSAPVLLLERTCLRPGRLNLTFREY
ncbi:hypothetical protein Ddye_014976 [Dipteronia dyeriana]|uniref:Fe2OG dioxygenase domain-containing protein n=1 Tax=Dipteronia dyeriana TaxID=168575 RepID=A0AAD9U4F1_9ROSI|nr:hypothetical protein Ddye_014976 [Dipteronia dyeriana]